MGGMRDDKAQQDGFEDMLTRFPKWFWTKSVNPPVDWKMNFNNSNDLYSNSTGANEHLIKLIRELNEQNMSTVDRDTRLPDMVCLPSSFSYEKGLNISLLVNNIMVPTYHRNNGFTKTSYISKPSFPNITNSSYTSALVPTPSSLSSVNLFSNLFLLSESSSPGRSTAPMTLQLSSALLSTSSLLAQLLSSILAIVSTTLFPISLSMTFPLMLYSFVVDKEEKVKDRLEEMGLVQWKYWGIAAAAWWAAILAAIVAAWWAAGYLALGGDTVGLFGRVDSRVLGISYAAWVVAQIGMAVLVSTGIKKARTATFVGYVLGVFSIMLFSGMSLYVFPRPGKMPMFLNLIPQAAFCRAFYLILADCIDGACYPNLASVDDELLAVCLIMYGSGIVYFVIGILLSEPIIPQLLHKINPSNIYPKYLKQFLESSKETETCEASATEYKAKVFAMDEKNTEIVMLAKNLTKVYVFLF